jgi:hypothetical protein
MLASVVSQVSLSFPTGRRLHGHDDGSRVPRWDPALCPGHDLVVCAATRLSRQREAVEAHRGMI